MSKQSKLGYVQLSVYFIENKLSRKKHVTRVFTELLRRTNYSPVPICTHGRNILYGQCVCGRRELATKLTIGEQSVLTAIKHLVTGGFITLNANNRNTLVTIVNYNNYTTHAEGHINILAELTNTYLEAVQQFQEDSTTSTIYKQSECVQEHLTTFLHKLRIKQQRLTKEDLNVF